MKKIFRLIPVLVLLIATSCEKLDINTNPVQPVTTSSNLRLPAILGNMAYHAYSHARYSSFHSFYLTSRYNTLAEEARWDYNQITRMGAWRWHYFDVGSNCIGLIERAEEEGSHNYMGVAKIILALSYLTATDSFGDMPFNQAYTGTFNPVYDPQEVVYQGVAKLLDEGIADIQRSGSGAQVMNEKSDLLYKGDMSKWIAFAHAIKARMLLHTANFQDGYDEVLAEAGAALNGFGDAIFNYSTAPTKDWERNMWGPTIPRPEWNFADIVNELNNTVSTDFFINYMKVNDQGLVHDPRLYKLTTPGAKNAYNGARASEGLTVEGWPTPTTPPTMDDFANLYNGYWTADNSPYPLFLKEELYFIKAEAAFYKNDKNTAYEAYRDGIMANMTRLGVASADIASYMASSKVKQSAGELLISDIMMQKYVALYLQPETWVDMRRYGYSATAYPGIYRPLNVLPEFGDKWIQRFPYDPQTEYIYNPQEIKRLGATARNWVLTPVWWAEKSQLKN
ncbi:SusD/RagB family nutrient-binding outer membrane lipoprotein [Pedobacter sp. SYSU D00535]|uniref:SusD/RagB family nutrient-binding outer membrane lipoprotein n=1 Tax=Pedobacter sp. SYSU D00535 TaxID=2810308 RepID=UPI001A96B91D|nr:SusD/RagB family nutrient-binding outer membrane lipoprotein [Pedobacter sp. SYSU D00535]